MALVSVLLLLLTYIARQAPEALPLHGHWHLGWENNFAAWWSGALLALAAAWTADGRFRSSRAGARAGTAWLAIALIILFLSADEIGSLHERLGHYGPGIGFGTWGLNLILGAMLGAAFIWAALRILRTAPADRMQLFAICVSFGLLVSVAGQEYLEHHIDWSTSAFAPFRTVVEEGTELAGMLVLLLAATMHRTPFPHGPFVALARYHRHLLIGALVLAPLLLVISWDGLPDKGRPLDGITSILFMGAAARALRTRLVHAGGTAFSLIAAAMTLSAIVVVAVPPHASFDLGMVTVHQRAAALALTVGAAALLVPRRRGGAGAVMILAALAFLALPAGYTAGMVGAFLVALACFGCAARQAQAADAEPIGVAGPLARI